MNKKIHWSIPLVDLEDSKLFLKILIAKSKDNKIDLNKVKETFEEQWPSKKNDDIVKFFKDLNIISELMVLKKINRKWALVSRKNPKNILKWFGIRKPSEKQIKKEERRMQYNNELTDKNIALKEDEVLDYIVKKMYLEIVAFKLMISILKEEGYLSKGELKNKVTKRILEYAKKNNPKGYREKQKDLNKRYKDITAWKYPEPSFNRFLRFAESVELITISKVDNKKSLVKFSEEKLNEILKEPKEFTFEEFEKEFYETYDQRCNSTKTIFQSIDKTREIMCERLGISEDLFNKYWIEVYERNPKKIQTFQSKIDENEKGLKVGDNLVYKYRIIR